MSENNSLDGDEDDLSEIISDDLDLNASLISENDDDDEVVEKVRKLKKKWYFNIILNILKIMCYCYFYYCLIKINKTIFTSNNIIIKFKYIEFIIYFYLKYGKHILSTVIYHDILFLRIVNYFL